MNCANAPASPVQVPSLIPFIADTSARQAEDSFNAFFQQIAFQSRLSNMFVGNQPMYPSYLLPTLANYQVSLHKPLPNSQIFSGLTADPALKYLTQPGVDARTKPSVATGIAPTTLNVAAVLDANLGLAPSPNSVISSSALTAGIFADFTVAATPNETVAPKTSDRLTLTTPTSSLLGSKLIKEPISPQVTFTNARAK